MANNRYFIACRCGKLKNIGKSLGDGIYNMGAFSGRVFKPEEIITNDKTVMPSDLEHQVAYGKLLEDIYEWLWKHINSCVPAEKSLPTEWSKDLHFEIIGEYDDRVDYRKKELFE